MKEIETIEQKLTEKATNQLKKDVEDLIQPILRFGGGCYFSLKFAGKNDNPDAIITFDEIRKKLIEKLIEMRAKERVQTEIDSFMKSIEELKEQVDDLYQAVDC